MNASIFVIVNPAAGRGRSLQRLGAFQDGIASNEITQILHTRERGDEERLAHIALGSGASCIVAVGGDGTCSGVANAILRAGNKCRLGVLPAGTGNDFAKTLGIHNQTPQQIAALVSMGAGVAIDVGVVDGRFFLNSCGFGFDPSVLEASNRVRFLKGDAVYIYSALRQLFTYRGVEVTTDIAGARRGAMLMVTVSNGRWLGGAFKIAPHASVLDGKLDACFFSDSSVVGRAKLFLGAMRGTHVGLPSVTVASLQQLALTFPSSPLMEIDGELHQARSATVELNCLSRTLSVIAAPGAPL